MDQAAYAAAQARVQQQLDFYRHLATYVLVNGGLFTVDWLPDGRINWAMWPLLGWGIGVAAHGLRLSLRWDALEQKLLARELARQQRSQR